MKHILLCLFASTVALATAVAEGPPPGLQVTNEQTILHASEVYLLKAQTVAGARNFYVEAIWRHNPPAGAPPAIGSKMNLGITNKASEVVVFEFNPRLPNASGGRTSRRIVPVMRGQVFPFGISADDLRQVTESTQWVPSPSE